MVKSAFIFPGQGAQYVGMGKGLFDNFKESRNVFEEANEAAGFDIARLCFEGPKEQLSKTEICQPAIFTVSIAALMALKEVCLKIELIAAAGLSLGEYTALVAAQSIRFDDGVRLLIARGRFMDEASKENPGRMASIIGLDLAAVESICKETDCEIANLNCPGQMAISGRIDAIEKAIGLAGAKGAKRAVILDVSGPFHSSLMNPAAVKLKNEVEKVEIRKPKVKVVSNFTADYEDEPHTIRENLVRQINNRTRWEDSMRLMIKDGIDIFFEIGPGRILSGLMKKIDGSIKVYNIETPENLEGIRDVIKG